MGKWEDEQLASDSLVEQVFSDFAQYFAQLQSRIGGARGGTAFLEG